ncbi:MAG: lysine-2,3-aminomutase-like protein [Alphaproteobacteria bacterium]|nr:lysine-2,3-aminomutase-like protein [Alphaproteobacteria bacterium]MBL6940132.1 lysine-2,3-aminomutase-like protein [Alphaproteobacteria bacterium]MBL7100219.1 lysine-2,3-aminomutase-like protein [Alphaproteobacteria bacterium]
MKPPYRTPRELADGGWMHPARVPMLDAVAERFAVSVSPEMAGLLRHESIARQFLPSEAELTSRAEDLADPIGDGAHSPVKGIVHRHPDRVLFKAVAVCAVYCRFCFRREMVGSNAPGVLAPDEMEAAYDYIAAHPEIWEVIVTGGDPFVLSPRRVQAITERLAAIGHVKIVRWHTRVPVVDPASITDDFVAALIAPGVASWIALHANAAEEFSPAARRAIARLVDAGIQMVSQSVLLKGVNDSVEQLEALMRIFVENRIKPYYLHHPDRAPGTSHFRMKIAQGRALVRALRGRLSGIAVPTYVLDIPGGHAKVPLLSEDVVEVAPDHWRIRDHAGNWHDYRD